MLRYLAAIGMSRMTSSKELSGWVDHLIKSKADKPEIFQWPGFDRTQMEIVHHMGPFRIILKGHPEENASVQIYSALPGVRPGTTSHVRNWEMGMDSTHLVVFGEEELNGGVLAVRMERTGHMMNLPYPPSGERGTLHYSALSIEGKILLGLERTEQDEKMYEEEDKWRQEMLERLRSGDEEAMREMEEDYEEQEREIADRLQREDLFSVLEGFFNPIEDVINGVYHVLGTILDVEKAFNPETEEWVWHLQLDVMGSPLNVYIHPDDLVGMPMKGFRFFGKVILVGHLIPG